jgi:hypothetical protein
MKLFCKHNYEIIKEHEIKSQMQMMIENGMTSLERGTSLMLISKYVIVYKCKKCNKIKETIISNE